MRAIIFMFALCLAALPCAHAAQTPPAAKADAEKAATQNAGDAQAGAKADKDDAKGAANKPTAPSEVAPGEYACQYYKVKLPEDWKAILPPQDKQGTVSAIFATATGSVVVTIIVAPSSGADATTIAGMFAEQFKAPKSPVEKNGLLTFAFPLQGATAQAFVGVKDKIFVVTTINGNIRIARNFIKSSIESGELASLLPQ